MKYLYPGEIRKVKGGLIVKINDIEYIANLTAIYQVLRGKAISTPLFLYEKGED
jgi:hypothetical protein